MPRRAKTIDLLRVVDLLQAHITPGPVSDGVRCGADDRAAAVWTLEALIRFGTAVVLRAPKALSEALADSLEGRDQIRRTRGSRPAPRPSFSAVAICARRSLPRSSSASPSGW